MRYCLQAEVNNPESGMNASDFLPTPEHWRQILHLPARVKQAWLNAMYCELCLLIVEKKCFKRALPNVDDPIIPITVKFRAKIRSDGLIDNLKAQGCMRGD